MLDTPLGEDVAQSPLDRSARRLRDWTVQTALPMWAARAQRPDGSWVEHLHLDGTPDPTAERRWRVVARQTVAYAQASLAGWYDGRAIARRSFDAYWSQGFTGRHVVHRIGADGVVTDDRHDLYDHAFALLACARMLQLTGEGRYRDAAQAVQRHLHSQRDPAGGWKEGAVSPLPRRQNPHMHLLEASLALFDATGVADDLDIAHAVMALFGRHFLRGEVIGEWFEADWTLDPVRGAQIEPGHMAEWVWLLGAYERATGRSQATARQTLYDRVFRQRMGRLFDAEAADGTIVRQTTRCWVHTEAIKAHLTMAEHGAPGAAQMAAASIDAMFGTFLLPDGRWADRLNACDANLASTVPVSTLYHIVGTSVEAARVSRILDER